MPEHNDTTAEALAAEREAGEGVAAAMRDAAAADDRRARIAALMEKMGRGVDRDDIIADEVEKMTENLFGGIKNAIAKAEAEAEARDRRNRRDAYVQAALTSLLANRDEREKGMHERPALIGAQAAFYADVAMRAADGTAAEAAERFDGGTP